MTNNGVGSRWEQSMTWQHLSEGSGGDVCLLEEVREESPSDGPCRLMTRSATKTRRGKRTRPRKASLRLQVHQWQPLLLQ